MTQPPVGHSQPAGYARVFGVPLLGVDSGSPEDTGQTPGVYHLGCLHTAAGNNFLAWLFAPLPTTPSHFLGHENFRV